MTCGNDEGLMISCVPMGYASMRCLGGCQVIAGGEKKWRCDITVKAI